MRLLITGGTGFVGATVAQTAVAAGHAVRVLARDRSRAAAFERHGIDFVVGELFDHEGTAAALEDVDVLVHAAAAFSYDRADGERMALENPALTEGALAAAARAGTPHVVDVSSVVVFKPHRQGARPGVTDLDSPRWTEQDIHWRDPYLRSKVLSDAAVDRRREEGLAISSVHPSAVVGPGDRGPGTSGALLLRLLRGRLAVDSALGWCDVRDLAEIILRVAESEPGRRYIVTSGTRGLREIASILDRETGRRRTRLFLPRSAFRALARLNDAVGGRLAPEVPPRPSGEYLLTTGIIDGASGGFALGRPYTPIEETIRDALAWWARNGMVEPREAGLAAAVVA